MRHPAMTVFKTPALSFIALLFIIFTAAHSPAAAASDSKEASQRVKAAIKSGKKTPDWLRDSQKQIQEQWDMSKPWKEARQEIRRLLENEDTKNQAIALLFLYKNKDTSILEEWGEYPLLAGYHDMALAHYLEALAQIKKYEPSTAKKSLASIYQFYGAYHLAKRTLEESAEKTNATDTSQFKAFRLALLYESIGDVSVLMKDNQEAQAAYTKAAQLFASSKQNWAQEKLKSGAERCLRKIQRLSAAQLSSASLKDGTYYAQSQAYSGLLKLEIKVSNNTTQSTVISHQEKIHQHAIQLIPAAIDKQQRIAVDAVLGATVTSDAISDAAYQCLRQAGL